VSYFLELFLTAAAISAGAYVGLLFAWGMTYSIGRRLVALVRKMRGDV